MGDALDALLRAAANEYRSRRAAVEALSPAEPIYSLVLAHDGEGNDPLPPAVGVGLASERDGWLNQHGAQSGWFIWNPAEYRHYARGPLALTPALHKLASSLNAQRQSPRERAQSVKLLERAASELRATAWPDRIKRTDDFVVYVVDFELAGIERALKTGAGAKQVAAWRRLGWLPRASAST